MNCQTITVETVNNNNWKYFLKQMTDRFIDFQWGMTHNEVYGKRFIFLIVYEVKRFLVTTMVFKSCPKCASII